MGQSLSSWVADNIAASPVFDAWWEGLSSEQRLEALDVRAQIAYDKSRDPFAQFAVEHLTQGVSLADLGVTHVGTWEEYIDLPRRRL